jgi:hypothetical protein
MPLEIVPGTGLGPIRLGMRPADVRAVFPEATVYEDWMGGNLNGCLTYHGLLLKFDNCDTSGPLPEASLSEIEVHEREDVLLFGKSLAGWKDWSILQKLLMDRVHVERMPDNWYSVPGKFELAFDAEGILTSVVL